MKGLVKSFEVGGLEHEKWRQGVAQGGTASIPGAGILLSALRPRHPFLRRLS